MRAFLVVALMASSAALAQTTAVDDSCLAAYDSTKPVVSRWVVSANRGRTIRPAFNVVTTLNGTDTGAVSKWVAYVGATCNCPAIQIVKGLSVYCKVASAPDAVALCNRAP